jgi:hypothetical protein
VGGNARLRGTGAPPGTPKASDDWNVDFRDGSVNNNNCDNDNAVRLVRGGE